MAKRKVEVSAKGGFVFRSSCLPNLYKVRVVCYGDVGLWFEMPPGASSMTLSKEDARTMARLILRETDTK